MAQRLSPLPWRPTMPRALGSFRGLESFRAHLELHGVLQEARPLHALDPQHNLDSLKVNIYFGMMTAAMEENPPTSNSRCRPQAPRLCWHAGMRYAHCPAQRATQAQERDCVHAGTPAAVPDHVGTTLSVLSRDHKRQIPGRRRAPLEADVASRPCAQRFWSGEHEESEEFVPIMEQAPPHSP